MVDRLGPGDSPNSNCRQLYPAMEHRYLAFGRETVTRSFGEAGVDARVREGSVVYHFDQIVIPLSERVANARAIKPIDLTRPRGCLALTVGLYEDVEGMRVQGLPRTVQSPGIDPSESHVATIVAPEVGAPFFAAALDIDAAYELGTGQQARSPIPDIAVFRRQRRKPMLLAEGECRAVRAALPHLVHNVDVTISQNQFGVGDGP